MQYSELRALAETRAGGTGGIINVQTAGADIDLNATTVQASGAGSQVLLSVGSTAAGTSGHLTMDNYTTLSADVLKVQALDARTPR